jgi:hypothetical protein
METKHPFVSIIPGSLMDVYEKELGTSKAAAALGKLGGKAGTGKAKVRGDSAYYAALAAKRKPKT